MKAKNLALVSIILIALLAYIYSFELPRSEQKQIELAPFSKTLKSQIAAFSIRRASESFKLVNSKPQKGFDKSKMDKDQLRLADSVAPSEWSLADLGYNLVDSSNLNAVITQIAAYSLGQPLPAAELDSDKSKYGLAAPEVGLTVERLDEAGKPTSLAFDFGKKSDFLAKRYVRYTRPDGSSDIFLTDDLLFFAVNKGLKDFRRKDPISFNDSEMQKAEFAGSAVKVTLEKKANAVPGQSGDHWVLVEPVSASADQSKVAESLRNVRNLKVKEFLEGEASKGKSGLFEHPNLTVKLFKTAQQTDPLVLKVAYENEGTSPKTFFSVSSYPAIFEAESNPTAALLENPSSFRQTKFFDIDVDQVAAFKLSGTLVPNINAEKKDENWKIADEAGDSSFIRQFLLDLKDLQAKDFPVLGQELGFSNPSYKIVITTTNTTIGNDIKPVERSLVIGAAIPGTTNYYGGVDNLSEPFIITKQDLDKIIPKLETLLVVATPNITSTPN